jgi:SAM-dependent methyltransferase
MHVLKMFFPNCLALKIHESSPAMRGVSRKLSAECGDYSFSYYDPEVPLGKNHPTHGYRCEDIERLTFDDESFDLFITQDVMEHVLSPSRAFSAIARTLKPGGAHIFTTPLVNKAMPSRLRAKVGEDGVVVHLEPATYHGNPICKDGSLVTVDWGFDICRYILDVTGLFTQIVFIDDISKGIRAEYIEVLATFKPNAKSKGIEVSL